MMRILFGTDGSEPAESARRLLEKVGVRDNVNVTVLSVLPVPPDQGEAEIVAARDVVESAVEALLAAGFKADRRTMRGHPGATIVETLERGNYDLALLGAGTKSWLDRLLLGSTSMGVLHGSSSSVLIVREALPEGPPTRIVAGVDGSPDSRFAVETLIGLVDPPDCVVTVLAVVETPLSALAHGPGIAYGLSGWSLELEREMSESARRHADEAAARLRDAGFTSDAKTVVGSASIRLLEEAESQTADLVVVGARGHGPIERMVLGSVSDRMARYARAALVARRADTA